MRVFNACPVCDVVRYTKSFLLTPLKAERGNRTYTTTYMKREALTRDEQKAVWAGGAFRSKRVLELAPLSYR